MITKHLHIRRPPDRAVQRLAHRGAVTGLGAALCLIVFMFVATSVSAQQLEPRSYANTPVGLNFLIAGYGYTEGTVGFDPSLPVTDAHLRTNTAVFAYARSLGAWGDSAKFDVTLPYGWLWGHGLFNGQPAQREISGFGDPRLRFSMNFYGAPALSMKDFADYRQDLIIGASLSVWAPFSQYDTTKLVNIGTNRWSFKPELGISKAWGSWTVEVAPSVTFYTDNNDFLNGGTLAQAPIYAVQGHIIHGFPSGIWFALDGTFYTGGRTTVNGVRGDTMQTNTRAGLTITFPVDRHNSVKTYVSNGTASRTDSYYNAIGVLWQYRWGGGY